MSDKRDYDAIIIGGGHNGLVASCYLAKKGLKTLVLEKNSFVGGQASTLELFPGFKFNIGAHMIGFFPDKLLKELELERFGFRTFDVEPQFFSPYPSGRYFMWYFDLNKTLEGLKEQFSPKDVEGFRKYVEFWRNFAAGIGAGILNPPVSFGKFFELLRGAEAEDVLRKVFFYGARDFLDEFIESEEIKGTCCFFGVDVFWGGPNTPGTNLLAGMHFVSGKPFCFVKGGMGGLSEALAKVLQNHKGTLRLNSPVNRIIIEKGKAIGVQLENQEEITGRVILSNLDPQNTFLRRLEAENLPKDFVERIRNMKFNAGYIQAFCCLKDLPDYKLFPGKKVGPQHRCVLTISPSPEYIERAWDDCKYGKPSSDPIVLMTIPSVYDPDMAPPGNHVAGIMIQYAPYTLKEGSWDRVKEELADRAVDIITQYAPNFRDSILNRKVYSMLDYEELFGATKGNPWGGEMIPSQLFSFRPVPGWSQYKTPIENLYLCGSGAHPGGGVSGAPGHNAAQVVLEEWERKNNGGRDF